MGIERGCLAVGSDRFGAIELFAGLAKFVGSGEDLVLLVHVMNGGQAALPWFCRLGWRSSGCSESKPPCVCGLSVGRLFVGMLVEHPFSW